MTFTIHSSFNDIAHKYDGFILDQYGVMHNGRESLPGAVTCIEKLSSMGKKLIILSNTSAPAEVALAKLSKLGFNPNNFVGAVTSGEEASRFIRETYCHPSSDNNDILEKKKAIFFTWADEMTPQKFLKKCETIESTANFDEADLVIVHGSEVMQHGSQDGKSHLSLGNFMESGDLAGIEPILEKCKENDLPMVCANPDFVVKVGDSIAHMPGKKSMNFVLQIYFQRLSSVFRIYTMSVFFKHLCQLLYY